MSTLLPIDCSHGFVMDPAEAREIGKGLAGEYATAEPFPHIAIDNFLPAEMAEKLLAHFPIDSKAHDRVYQKGYGGLHKRQISPYDCDEVVRGAFGFFNSAPMLQFIEGITGIQSLLSDPYFTGGGLHEISTGGLLGVHADFRVNEGLQLIRRVNILIYLNKDWQDAYNGKLELWDRKMTAKVRSVSPVFNRCVIFNTEDDTFHGHPDPLLTPEGITRKSIALYYYTAAEVKNDSGESRHTLYVARPDDSEKNKADARKLAQKRDKRAKKRNKGSAVKSVKKMLVAIKQKIVN